MMNHDSFLTVWLTDCPPVGNRSRPARKVTHGIRDAEMLRLLHSELPAGRDWGKAGRTQAGADKHVAGDRWRRFYRIECRGRVERRGRGGRGGMRCARS